MSSENDSRFLIQQVSQQEWLRATLANVAADHMAGYKAVTELFLAGRSEPEFAELATLLREGDRDDVAGYVEKTRGHSLVFLVLMLTGGCNANCEVCFTGRRRKANELDPGERHRLLAQARDLGARFVYVPGEGEPTINRGFWEFLDDCRELGLEAIVFTNGIVFSDPASCEKYWKCDPDTAVRRLAQYPVSFYHKFWSTQTAMTAEMMRIPERFCPYVDHEGTPVPTGLKRLLEGLPRERVGIEVMAERRNADEILDTIVPFADEQGLPRIVEMIQHNGRVFGDGSFDPSEAQAGRLQPLLSATSCMMAPCKAVVTCRGYLSPRIAVLEHQIPGELVDIRHGELFDLLHETEYVTSRRYDINTCLCEKMPLQMACCKTSGSSVRIPVQNIAPKQLDASTPTGGQA